MAIRNAKGHPGHFRRQERPLRVRAKGHGQACQRRMNGIWRPTRDGGQLIYYTCPYNPKNPRHTAACPDHPATSVSIREVVIMAGLTDFMDQYVFGPDRAALLAALIPTTTAEHAAARERQEDQLRAELDRINTAQAGLMTELARLGGDTRPATNAYRERIQDNHADLHDQRAPIQAQLDQLQAIATPDQHPALLDELPSLTSQLTDAPPTWSKPSSTPWTYRSSTGPNKTRPPSGPPSPTPPPPPSTPCLTTPA